MTGAFEVPAEMSVPQRRTRIFLVDDHDLIRTGQRDMLAESFDIVGEAANVADAVAGIKETKPDVVLVDVRLGQGHGAGVVREVLRESEGVRFLALSAYSTRDDVIDMVRAGVAGYVAKSATRDLVEAIDLIAVGIPFFSRELAAAVHPQLDDIDLNEDELGIVNLRARGHSIEEIAAELGQSVEEVNAVLRRMLLRLRDPGADTGEES